jgi:hypothetical protein
MGFDRNPEQLVDEKTAFLADLLARDVRLFFTHDAGCSLARLTQLKTGRYATTEEQAVVDGLAL